eukprot:scaffold226819_cov39-Tisochrysis_lutea.AAC.2
MLHNRLDLITTTPLSPVGTKEQNAKLDHLRQELDALTAQESMLPLERAKLKKALDQQRQLLVEREMALQQMQAGKDHKLAELNKGCTMYRNMLGLEFERIGGVCSMMMCSRLFPFRAASHLVAPIGFDLSCEPHLMMQMSACVL